MSRVHTALIGCLLIGLALLSVRLKVLDATAISGLVLILLSHIGSMVTSPVVARRKRSTRETPAIPESVAPLSSVDSTASADASPPRPPLDPSGS